ncbi:MAG: cytochrome c oxidase subunit 3, partial [Betaproteobacteria bacterium]|nr:cytochrome c oxidase subunit 3 [Betaproteobacteria bacterium]
MKAKQEYYIPDGTYWPIIGSVGVATLFVGFANQMHGASWGGSAMALGFAVLVFMLFGWFGQVVKESSSGVYNSQVDRSFRWGMRVRPFGKFGAHGFHTCGAQII